MKIDTLSFIQCLLSGHHPTVFHPHAQVLVPAIITAVSDTFYKFRLWWCSSCWCSSCW